MVYLYQKKIVKDCFIFASTQIIEGKDVFKSLKENVYKLDVDFGLYVVNTVL